MKLFLTFLDSLLVNSDQQHSLLQKFHPKVFELWAFQVTNKYNFSIWFEKWFYVKLFQTTPKMFFRSFRSKNSSGHKNLFSSYGWSTFSYIIFTVPLWLGKWLSVFFFRLTLKCTGDKIYTSEVLIRIRRRTFWEWFEKGTRKVIFLSNMAGSFKIKLNLL